MKWGLSADHISLLQSSVTLTAETAAANPPQENCAPDKIKRVKSRSSHDPHEMVECRRNAHEDTQRWQRQAVRSGVRRYYGLKTDTS